MPKPLMWRLELCRADARGGVIRFRGCCAAMRCRPWGVASFLAWGALVSTAAAEPSRPNIVVILADDMGIGDVAAYNPDATAPGAPTADRLQAVTPNLDKFASQGMRFTNAHAPASVCTPTRYGVLMGRYAFRSRQGFGLPTQYSQLFLYECEGRTIGDVMRDSGYRTGYVGKWHLGYKVYNSAGDVVGGSPSDPSVQPDWTKGLGGGPTDRGFDESFGHAASADIPPYKYFRNHDWVTPHSVWTEGKPEFKVDLMRPGWRDPDYDPRMVTRTLRDQAVEYVERQAGDEQPFFLFFALSSPHSPTAPHPDFQGRTAGRYTDYVAEVDDAVGHVMAALERQGIAQNTLVFFTSDNGAYEGMSKRRANNPSHESVGFLSDRTGVVKELRGEKFVAYEGGHREPFLVRWGDGDPSRSTIKPGAVSGATVNLQDLYRTVATVGGATLSPDEGVDSYNLLPLLTGAAPSVRDSNFEMSNGRAFTITARDDSGVEWKLIYAKGGGNNGDTIVDANQPNILPQLAKLQLYNLTSDLHEDHNLLASDDVSPELSAKVVELHSRMYGYITSGRSAP